MKAFHYASIDDLRRHVRDWLLAYNYAKQLKALRFKTPFEAIRQISETKPEIFSRLPSHDMLGPNTFRRFRDWREADAFKRIFDALSDEPDMEYTMVDATIVKVHRHGQGAKGRLRARPLAGSKVA